MTQVPQALQELMRIKALEDAKAEAEREIQQHDLETHLNEQVQIAYPVGEWDAYHEAIRNAGNPPDQIRNFERAGIIMQAKQLQFAAWCRQADYHQGPEEIGLGGARGPGKSFAMLAQVATDDCQRFPGLKVLFLRKSQKTGEQQLKDLIKKILPRLDYKYRQRPTNLITFENGSQILVGHFKTDDEALNYQGLEYDVIVLEEATQLSFEAYEALLLSNRSSKGWRPRIYNSTNPGGKGHKWYKLRFVRPEKRNVPLHRRDPRTKFIPATIADNMFVDTGYRGKLDNLTGIRHKMFRLGDWDISAGAYFSKFNEGIHIIPHVRTIPPDAEIWMSMDYGYAHWNMTYLHYREGEIIYTVRELAHRYRYPSDIAKDIHELLAEYNLTRDGLSCFLVGMDAFRSSGIGKETIAAQYAELGLPLAPADNSAGSRVGRATELARLIGDPERGVPPSWYVTESCAKLIDTLPYLEHDPRNPEDVEKINCDENGDGGDDAYDGATYGLYRPHVSTMA